MTKIEAIKALMEGKKIALKIWEKEEYLCLGRDTVIDQDGDIFGFRYFDSLSSEDEWELVE